MAAELIGGGWAARFALHGWDVAVFDPHPDAAKRIADVLENARKSLPALADFPMPAEGIVDDRRQPGRGSRRRELDTGERN